MALYVGERTSLALWRALGDSAPRSASSRASVPSGAPPNPKALDVEVERYLRTVGFPDQPAVVLVSADRDRRVPHGLRCRIWAADLPPKSFAKLANGLFISSPELTFLQMAAHLSLMHLIELGFELCGCYALLTGGRGMVTRREPLTSADKLAAYLGRFSNVKGLKKARRAARYIIDGAASPMEAKLAMILCLPPAMGGFGFPRASLNQEMQLELLSAGGLAPERRVVRCDLLWPAPYNVAIEYESSEWHLSNRKFAEDSSRRNDIVSTNVRVLTVTKNQILNLVYWPNLAGRIGALMGRKVSTKAKGHLAARDQLYAELFGHLFDRYDADGYAGRES